MWVGTLKNDKWFKVQYKDTTGYIATNAIILKTKADSIVRTFIENLGQNDDTSKIKSCKQLLRWNGKCKDHFIRDDRYGGIIKTKIDEFQYFDLDIARNGFAEVRATYKIKYDS